ncbi:DUF2306 domain-containing protein [uncultured Sphingomonas sp.]|uniref:DUF2306 domain-containing protein n=1 Tax=uncultured Sphingomonas sp. TaxID=158754 RepID=UPI002637C2F8|nr:DUF2306 domain-containing protein [uncultured Sphingomonas sp.]
MTSLTLPLASPPRRNARDLSPAMRLAVLVAGGTLSAMAAVALGRAALGLAPAAPAIREVAVALHLTTVLPALPLGLYLLLARKGGPRHRMLGKLWVALMLVAALSALGIRHLNHGQFSAIHLFVPLTVIGLWRAVATARSGRIATHRTTMVALYLGGLIGAGAFAFAPARIMGLWLFG